MADIHIEEFYKDLAKILLHLHSYFPRKSQIYVEDISGPDTADEYGLHSRRHQACFSTMLWLADEGYIRFEDTIRQEAIDQAVLTRNAFVRLNRLARLPNQPQMTKTGEDVLERLCRDNKTTEPQTNIQLIRLALRTETSTKLALVLETILFG